MFEWRRRRRIPLLFAILKNKEAFDVTPNTHTRHNFNDFMCWFDVFIKFSVILEIMRTDGKLNGGA